MKNFSIVRKLDGHPFPAGEPPTTIVGPDKVIPLSTCPHELYRCPVVPELQ